MTVSISPTFAETTIGRYNTNLFLRQFPGIIIFDEEPLWVCSYDKYKPELLVEARTGKILPFTFSAESNIRILLGYENNGELYQF